jgi:cell division transport system ATP-binding protein
LRNRRRYELRRQVGTVFQDFRLLPDMTAEQNVAYALEINGETPKVVQGRTMEALELVDLKEKAGAYPGQLSGGEQQRVAVARALIARPRLLLADEPTGNLDPLSSSIVMDLLLAINSAGTTVIVATHDEHIVNRLMQRVITMGHGEVLADRRGGYHIGRSTAGAGS